MDPWYKIAIPRKEVREGRSFNPDEFAIHLEQIIAKTAPEDYREPTQFFARTCFTRALREHACMVLRRLSGETVNTAPVMTLITQFGGGKTHTLAALYHLVTNGANAAEYSGVADLIAEAGIKVVPQARVAAFVGNAWDPQEGRETPWIDIARQLAGDKGVAELGAAARNTPPGTEALARVFNAAGGPVLLLFDEVLNFLNRHRGMADHFHAFIQNLTVATTGAMQSAAIISLPRSQVEMTDWDMQWQDRITKVVRRVAKDLIANDEAEISDVVRRRLFENIGSERIRKNVSKAYADRCFERRAQLPPEWTAVDSATTEAKSREYLRERFEVSYPFHPATLTVFQRKWQALTQYQQTRGTLAMLAQWISWAYRTGFTEARREPLITIGSAPMEVPEFRSVVLGQLGESRLLAAIDADISGSHSHARALDADTTSVDTAAFSLEDKSYFIVDGAAIQDTPKLTLVVVEADAKWTPACAGTADRGSGALRQQIAEWTKLRGKSPRLYPGSLVWCVRKPGRDFREKVELWLAWKRVAKEVAEGTLGGDFDRTDRAELHSKVGDAEEAAKDEVWGGYRFVVISDYQEPDGLKTIDLGAGHSSGSETLCGRVITALKSQALLNESVGAGYIERNWPPVLKESGAWPLSSLRQSFLNGSLTRLLDPDTILRGKIVEFVSRGDFGLASGQKPDGGYERVLFNEYTDPADVTFESGVFLLLKSKAKALKAMPEPATDVVPEPDHTTLPTPIPEPGQAHDSEPEPAIATRTFRITGEMPPEIWNRFGTKILPKLRSGADLQIGIDFSVTVDQGVSKTFEADLKQILEDLGLSGKIEIE
jgi:hypothetical protein